ncbi:MULTISPECIES: tail protein X [Serratia]|jgi:phage tail protein X|uniref:tail protein X n=1 Tax=Serratia TaxID=613 RepID=UPI000EFBCC1E|nr:MULTISPECIES: tail protein X [Serratia]AYO40739.1 phage tail protein [Serratia sp. P2ACOL2]MCE9938973.1 tail protein X [Serratia liquefaciens]HEJ7189556.1 tail protein X [Serratia marcescens]HEJ8127254.1 tail protein X [Serratia marcescens]
MPTNYLTREGDVLDAVCAAHYGTENLSQTVVTVLDANRELAALGAVYPAGLIITLPDIETPTPESPIQLWD